MRTLGNILWFIFAGLILGVSWFLVGVFWCITIIGIPIGKQCFKFAGFMIWPFGKDVVFSSSSGSKILNILWILFGGINLAITSVISGIVLCVTIVGIPFGIQCFKFAKLSLMPFGSEVSLN